MSSLPHGTSDLNSMQGQSGDDDYPPGPSTIPQIYDPSTPAYFVLCYDSNGMPMCIPYDHTHPNATIPAPSRPPGSQLPPTLPIYDSGANPPRGSHDPDSYTLDRMTTPMDHELLGPNYPTMTVPGGSTLVSSPGPSILPPGSPDPPSEYHCRHHHQQIPETSRSHPTRPSRLRCLWDNCPDRKGFKNEHVLLRHLKEQHIFSGGLRCHLCPNRTFKRAQRLDEHLRNYHPDTTSALTVNAYPTSPAVSGNFMNSME